MTDLKPVLLPCPFCGVPATQDGPFALHSGSKCPAFGKHNVAAWNRRASPPAAAPEREAPLGPRLPPEVMDGPCEMCGVPAGVPCHPGVTERYVGGPVVPDWSIPKGVLVDKRKAKRPAK